jgi:hypothetical protein
MLKDIHLRFVGFHGSAGRCQIRLARLGRDKPLVIVCSQYKNYHGTSVTNALEIIAETLFYQIANNQVDGVSFDMPLPIYEEWHADVNFFDKILAKTFPEKYGGRFSTRRLNIPEIFSKIVWIQNYPVDTRWFSFEKHVSVVTLNDSGSPTWQGRPTAKWLIEKTGFDIDALLPQDDSLDLDAVESKIETLPQSEEELRSIPGYHHVRWTEEIVRFLPGLLSSARAYRGRTDQSDLEELSVHDEIEKFLAIKLPARELFTRVFQFSKELGIYKGGKEKAIDFALFTPEGDRVDSLLEVKRTSSKSAGLQSEVTKDIARLLLLSQRFHCSCYLLICGNMNVIRNELAKLDKYISLVDEDPSRDRQFSVPSENFDKEYRSLIDRFQIATGFSRLQGENSSGSNLAILWQIAANRDNLRMHRPYEFNLGGITRG